MALTITNTTATTSTITMTLTGDGSSTSISIDLKKAPFNLIFNDNPPSAVVSMLGDNSSATIDGTILTVTFPSAPNSAQGSILLIYNGVS